MSSEHREQKLNQVVAVERSVKSKTDKEITALYHLGQKGDPFTGFTKQYRALREDGDKLPPDNKRVQADTRSVLRDVSKSLGELFDITAARDYANCSAKASVMVDGRELIKDAPVTFLMFLKKYLTDVRTIVDKLPTLSLDQLWELDPNSNIFRSETTETIRTQKVKESVVLLQPTKEHPGKAELIDKDIPVGTWDTTHLSGAMPVPLKQSLIDKIEKLQRAVQYAMEEANTISAPKKEVGGTLLGWLFEGAT